MDWRRGRSLSPQLIRFNWMATGNTLGQPPLEIKHGEASKEFLRCSFLADPGRKCETKYPLCWRSRSPTAYGSDGKTNECVPISMIDTQPTKPNPTRLETSTRPYGMSYGDGGSRGPRDHPSRLQRRMHSPPLDRHEPSTQEPIWELWFPSPADVRVARRASNRPAAALGGRELQQALDNSTWKLKCHV